MTEPWSPEEEARFLELLRQDDGRMSLKEIGDTMRRTKGALIGKANRLESRKASSEFAAVFAAAWTRHCKQAGPFMKEQVAPRKRFIHPPPRVVTTSAAPRPFKPPPPGGVKINSLTDSSCRFMIGEAMYCGKQVFKRSYCEHHYNATRIIKAG